MSDLRQDAVIDCETISLCRDIIHNQKPEHVLSQLSEHFDRILVRGDNRFTDLKSSQDEWQAIKQPIEYMGNYITEMPEKSSSMAEEERHVVVFGGGGYYAKDLPFFENVIRSRQHSDTFGTRIWDIYVSENARKHEMLDPDDILGERKITAFDYLERLAAQEGHGMIRVLPPIDSEKFRQNIADAAMPITRGGYNTTFELLAAKQPQLVCPRPSQEQVQRANTLYKHGIAQIFPDYPIPLKNNRPLIEDALRDPHNLAHAIDLAPKITATVPELNNHGAETTATRLIALARERQSEVDAASPHRADGNRWTDALGERTGRGRS